VVEKTRVLVVDDSISFCKTMSLFLGRRGYAVTIATDGQEAVALVKDSPFDIIFMDIMMPLMNGVQACRIIKQIRPQAVVIMMTASAVENLVQAALEEGACGVLYKPLDMNEVLTLIEKTTNGTADGLSSCPT
jgi:CheY-like chemotaxis protein